MPTRLPHDWFSRPLPAGVAIGQRSWIYSSFAFLHCHATARVRIGRDTGVYNGTFFELGEMADVRIGDFCSIVGAIICSSASVRIGSYVFLAHEVVIADTDFAVPPIVTACLPKRAARISIGDNAWVGMRAVLTGGISVGEGAIIGAGAVVNFDVPPYSIVAGNPAKVVGAVPH